MTEVFWIPTSQNPADGLTKEKCTPALRSLMIESKVSLSRNARVEREAITSP